MTELFLPDGHLSEAGLQALLCGQLDEMQRLEAAEHLGFCQPCMERYMALLTGESLLEPPEDLRLPVARRVRAKLMSQTARRYATAAVAAVLSLTLWGAGAFTWSLPELTPPGLSLTEQETPPPKPQQPPARGQNPTDPLTDGLDQVFGAVSRACDELVGKMTRPSPQSETTRGDSVHAEK